MNSSDISLTPPEVKYAGKQKFGSKVLVWMAICPKGVSAIHVQEKQCINAELYLDILKKKLVPFLNKHYTSRDEFFFWPDLASSHYARSVTT